MSIIRHLKRAWTVLEKLPAVTQPFWADALLFRLYILLGMTSLKTSRSGELVRLGEKLLAGHTGGHVCSHTHRYVKTAQ